MSNRSTDDVARRLELLPDEAWDRPVPPPAPWPPEQPWRTRTRLDLRLPIAAAAATVLLAIGVAVGLLASAGGGDGDQPRVAERGDALALAPVGARDAGAQGEVRLARGPNGEATVRLTGLRPNSRRDFYELWLLGADGELVSLGSFRVNADGDAQVRVPVPVDPRRFRFIDVSREPADGDPSHSTISVLRGPTV